MLLRRIGHGIGVAASYLPAILRDIVGLAAVGAIAYGAWMIYPPAGVITGGVLVLAGVMLLSAKGGKSQ